MREAGFYSERSQCGRLNRECRRAKAECQRAWLRERIEESIQNPPNRRCNWLDEGEIQVLATTDDPDEGAKGKKIRKPPLQLWYLRYLSACANDDTIDPDEYGCFSYFRQNMKELAREMAVEVTNNLGILGDCFVCAYIASVFTDPHATVADKKHAMQVELLHSSMIRRMRKQTKEYEQASAQYFRGEGGKAIQLEQDGIGKHNTFVPFLANNRSKSANNSSAPVTSCRCRL